MVAAALATRRNDDDTAAKRLRDRAHRAGGQPTFLVWMLLMWQLEKVGRLRKFVARRPGKALARENLPRVSLLEINLDKTPSLPLLGSL